jgi:hypothetical protein
MSCYFRHINDILQEAGININAKNRTHIDQAIHQILGTSYNNCPATWKIIKQQLKGDEQKRLDFVKKLRDTL